MQSTENLATDEKEQRMGNREQRLDRVKSEFFFPLPLVYYPLVH